MPRGTTMRRPMIRSGGCSRTSSRRSEWTDQPCSRTERVSAADRAAPSPGPPDSYRLVLTRRRATRIASGSRRLFGLLDHDAVDAVDLEQLHADHLAARRRHVLADVVGADRQFAMAAIDDTRELDRARPAEVDQRVHGGANRPPRIEYVVDEHDDLAAHVDGDLRAAHDRLLGDRRQVVAIQRDVEAALDRGAVLELRDALGDPLRERHAAALDAHEHEVVDPLVALD